MRAFPCVLVCFDGDIGLGAAFSWPRRLSLCSRVFRRLSTYVPPLRPTHAVGCIGRRGFVRALEDAVAIVDALAFPIDTSDRAQMLKIVNSCIGTKFTMRFGSLIAVRAWVGGCVGLEPQGVAVACGAVRCCAVSAVGF